MKQSTVFEVVIAICALVNTCILIGRVWVSRFVDDTGVYCMNLTSSYSFGLTDSYLPIAYVGDDYPETVPFNTTSGSIPLLVNITSDFPISGPNASKKWESIYPPGYGFVRLGDESRLLCVAMFHQLHCIEKMRIYLDDPSNKHVALPHQHHCMNYLRQLFLCKGDTTLEPIYGSEEGDIVDDSVDLSMRSGSGVKHSCGHWQRVYEAVEDNYIRWKAWWNMSSPWDASKV